MKTDGQKLIDRLEAWISGYMFLSDPNVALAVALWTVGTWTYDHFYAFPYLSITASTKGAGKTQLLKLLVGTTRNGKHLIAASPAAILRMIKGYNGHVTLLNDESETANSESKNFQSQMLNSGYQRGQTIPRAKGTDEWIEWPSYCPKAFAGIGDLSHTLRDRAIVVSLDRGQPRFDWEPEIVESEAKDLAMEIQKVLSTGASKIETIRPRFLDTRDQEVWTPIFSLASYLKLDKPTTDRLIRFANDNIGLKTADKRKSISVESEEKAVTARYGEKALRDLARVIRPGEKAIFSMLAVERMRDLNDAPWRTFRGSGLNADMLADLIRPFGVHTHKVRMHSGSGAREAKQTGGYYAKDVMASVPRQEENSDKRHE